MAASFGTPHLHILVPPLLQFQSVVIIIYAIQQQMIIYMEQIK